MIGRGVGVFVIKVCGMWYVCVWEAKPAMIEIEQGKKCAVNGRFWGGSSPMKKDEDEQ